MPASSLGFSGRRPRDDAPFRSGDSSSTRWASTRRHCACGRATPSSCRRLMPSGSIARERNGESPQSPKVVPSGWRARCPGDALEVRIVRLTPVARARVDALSTGRERRRSRLRDPPTGPGDRRLGDRRHGGDGASGRSPARAGGSGAAPGADDRLLWRGSRRTARLSPPRPPGHTAAIWTGAASGREQSSGSR